jgi:hypothetical protein
MTKEIKRPLKRPKHSVKWDQLFDLNDDGALCLNGEHNGEWKQYLIAEYLSESYRGPWPARNSYAFIIDLSKGCEPENVDWMTQNPDYRTVRYG